jgi:ubiquinone/menaquinone biosynthesis C-methylase UbiE
MNGEAPVSPDGDGGDLWEAHADWWIDEFTEGADPEYEEQVLPLAERELAGARRILDLGCGDGQVSRRVARDDNRVIGVDPTWNQISVARQRAGGPLFAQAGAGALPFADGAFDAVVACLVFEHVVDVDPAIAEMARVLEPGGRCCLFLNHPLLQTPGTAWIDDHTVDPPERYLRLGPYLSEHEWVEKVGQGVSFRFVHRPLSRYVNALVANGLMVEWMEEPAPPEGFLARAEEYREAAEFPRLMYLRLRRV